MWHWGVWFRGYGGDGCCWLDCLILVVFSNMNDSMIVWSYDSMKARFADVNPGFPLLVWLEWTGALKWSYPEAGVCCDSSFGHGLKSVEKRCAQISWWELEPDQAWSPHRCTGVLKAWLKAKPILLNPKSPIALGLTWCWGTQRGEHLQAWCGSGFGEKGDGKRRNLKRYQELHGVEGWGRRGSQGGSTLRSYISKK